MRLFSQKIVGLSAVIFFLMFHSISTISPAEETKSNPRIKAFCVDFNWGPKGFAPPGMYNQASAQEHFAWYKALGVNTIQTFCVSCCGYAWYRSEVAPVQPEMKGDFLKELTELGHAGGMKVMGYFCVGANTYWGEKHPDLSYGAPSEIHIPLTTEYLNYLCSSIADVLKKTDIDGFMLDWVYNAPHLGNGKAVSWMECEKRMYEELFQESFPGKDKITPEKTEEFHRRAVDRCWKRIHQTAKAIKPALVIWLSCFDLNNSQVKDSPMLKEVDWLMNEHPDPSRLASIRKITNPQTQLIQCICGWGAEHDADKLSHDAALKDVGFYGFAMPDAKTTLPPTESGDPRLAENAKNIARMRKIFLSE